MPSKKPTKLRPGTRSYSSSCDDDNAPTTSTPSGRSVPPLSFETSSKKVHKVQPRRNVINSSSDESESQREPQVRQAPPQKVRQAPQHQVRRHPGLVRRHPRQRRRVYANVEREIKKLQKSTVLLIPRLNFSRLVREVCQQITGWSGYRWEVRALEALQESSEYFLVGTFEIAQLLSFHARRVTLKKEDLQLARRIYCAL